MTAVTALAIVKGINTGVLVADAVMPLLERMMESNEDVSIEDLSAASGQTAEALIGLLAAIQRREARESAG